jgi:hypothetical protein
MRLYSFIPSRDFGFVCVLLFLLTLGFSSPVCTHAQTKPFFQRDYVYDSRGHLINTAEPDIYGPFPPTGLLGTYDPVACAVDLEWNATTDLGGSGVGKYLILRNGTQEGQTTNTSYADPVNIGATYTYTVIGVDNAGNLGPASSPTQVHTHTCIPGAPKKTSTSSFSPSLMSRRKIPSFFCAWGRVTNATYRKSTAFEAAL